MTKYKTLGVFKVLKKNWHQTNSIKKGKQICINIKPCIGEKMQRLIILN